MRQGRNRSKRVSQQQWQKYYLQLRRPLSPQLLTRRLLYKIIVDVYALIASARLQQLRYNQKNLRIVQYAGMLNALYINNQAIKSNIGQNIILPVSYIGSPRQIYNAYLNAIVLMRYYGPPNYFITFTYNLRQQEIQGSQRRVRAREIAQIQQIMSFRLS